MASVAEVTHAKDSNICFYYTATFVQIWPSDLQMSHLRHDLNPYHRSWLSTTAVA